MKEQIRRMDSVRTPICRTSVAAANPTKPIMPTKPTTPALKNAATAKDSRRIFFTGMPADSACVSPRLMMFNGLIKKAVSMAATAIRHKSPNVSRQLSCTREPLPHCITPRVSSLKNSITIPVREPRYRLTTKPASTTLSGCRARRADSRNTAPKAAAAPANATADVP